MSIYKGIGTKSLLIFSSLIFFYCIISGVIFQEWLAPNYFIGSMDGLVVGDSKVFHLIAKSKALEMTNGGFGMWELRPKGQSPAGIASIFYFIFGSSALSMLPFNAVIHALSGCLVVLVLNYFFSHKAAFFGGALFAINPTAFEWVIQIHRDGIFTLGFLLQIFCLVYFLKIYTNEIFTKHKFVKEFLICITIMPIGLIITWVSRPYFMHFSLILLFTVLVIFIFKLNLGIKKIAIFFGLIFILLNILTAYSLSRFNSPMNGLIVESQNTLGVMEEVRKITEPARKEIAEKNALNSGRNVGSGLNGLMAYQSPLAPMDDPNNSLKNFSWSKSSILPEFIEQKFYTIAMSRYWALAYGGNSIIDNGIALSSSFDIIKYSPRGVIIGLLSPLPNLWAGIGSSPAMTIARIVIIPITIISWFGIAGALIVLLVKRNDPSLVLLILFSLFCLLVYSVSYPNVGTLIRFRFVFYGLLTSVGFAYFFDMAKYIFIKKGVRTS